MVLDDEHHARGNDGMHQHHQTNIQTIGTKDGESKIPDDLAM
jgi:hypothetical protein